MRIVVGLVTGQDPKTVAEALRSHGARQVQGPVPSLPDVLVADFSEGDVESTVNGIAELPGVRYAELDELQSITD